MRSAGCVINDFADREIDPHVERTRERPLAAGRVRPGEAIALFVVLCLLAFMLVLTTNGLTVRLSFAGAALAVSYPFLKRVSSLPQLYLGLAFSWGIPMAYAAQSGYIADMAWWLVVANCCWVVSYDTMYAMVDREDDLRIGVKSTAILFGRYDRLAIGLFQLATLLVLFGIGRVAGMGYWFNAGLAGAAGFMVRQQFLISAREPARCFSAFLNNNWVGLAVFAGTVLSYGLPISHPAG
jgi:4-hydroxybenzoate polyprenyltransferase